MMKCEDCKKCADSSLRHLCFDKDVRDELLLLIEDAFKMQMDSENFLYDRNYTKQMIDGVSSGVKMYFDCMLPNKYE